MESLERSALLDETGVVKSAVRTLEILEYFDEVRQPLNIVAIATALDYPQSSTAALLRSLATIGYLQYDSKTRTYMPTDRVPFLGSWVDPALFNNAGLPRLMQAISQRTGQLVVLAARNDDSAQYIHVLNQPQAVSHHIRIGQRRALATSGVGQVLLSAMSEKDVKRLFHRVNAYTTSSDQRIDVAALLHKLENVRQRGYAFSRNLIVQGYGVIALPIPASCASRPLALGIGGQSDVLEAREVEIVEAIQEEMSAHLDFQTDEHKPQLTSGKTMKNAAFASYPSRPTLKFGHEAA